MSTLAQFKTVLPAGSWQVDPVHSQVGFAVEYNGGTFRGTFSPVAATLEVDDEGQATLAGSAPVEGVHVQDENLAAHLLSPDFFDAERTPELRFRSHEIERDGGDVKVVGDLTIRGIANTVELRGTIGEPLTDPMGRERSGLKLFGTVDRTRFGLDWNLPLPTGEPALANDVELTAELYLLKA